MMKAEEVRLTHGAGVILFYINQPEGNDGRGSDYRNNHVSPPPGSLSCIDKPLLLLISSRKAGNVTV